MQALRMQVGAAAIGLFLLVGIPPAEAKQHRSAAAKHAFQKEQPCPATGKRSGKCPGFVIDHVVPLACGGVDAPANMQWQTVAEGKAKDKWERKGCEKRL